MQFCKRDAGAGTCFALDSITDDGIFMVIPTTEVLYYGHGISGMIDDHKIRLFADNRLVWLIVVSILKMACWFLQANNSS